MTRDKLQELLTYIPISGDFVVKQHLPNSTYRVGNIIGTINNEGSISITLLGKNYLAHKLANLYMGGDYKATVGHVNGIRSDNSWENLIVLEKFPKGELTQETLRNFFNYDEVTGKFTRKKLSNLNYRVGSELGTITSRGYVQVNLNNKSYPLHRLIWLYMTGELPAIIDHKDRNPTNNAWSNLRVATVSQNAMNKKGKSGSITGIKGVTQYDNPKSSGYKASVSIDGIIYTKCFRTIPEATKFIKQVREEVHGEFACHANGED